MASATQTAAVSRQTGHIPQLDGLRGIAILAVVCYHFWSMPGEHASGFFAEFAWCFRLGWAGVDLFFVLSGFLIGGILIDARDSSSYYRTFYLRRAFRILPLYLILLVLFWCSMPFANRGDPLFALAFPAWSYASFTQNIAMVLYAGTVPGFHLFQFGAVMLAGTWSLAIEEQFYLLLPVAVRRLPVARLRFLAVTMILAAPVLRFAFVVLLRHKAAIAGYVLMPCRMDALGFGLLAAILLRRGPIPRKPVYLAIPPAVCGLALLQMVVDHFSPFTIVFGYSLTSFAGFVALLACLVKRESGPPRLTTWGPLRALGGVSYCVYLIHGTVLILAHRLLAQREPALDGFRALIVSLAAVAATGGIAAISMRLLEARMLRFGRRFTYEKKPSAASGAR